MPKDSEYALVRLGGLRLGFGGGVFRLDVLAIRYVPYLRHFRFLREHTKFLQSLLNLNNQGHVATVFPCLVLFYQLLP